MMEEPSLGDPLIDKGDPIQTNDKRVNVVSIEDHQGENRLAAWWDQLSRIGLAEQTLRVGTHLLSIALVLVVVWAMRTFYLRAQADGVENGTHPAEVSSESNPDPEAAAQNDPMPGTLTLPVFRDPASRLTTGIPRLALNFTSIPTRSRVEVINYLVQQGDSIFGIAERFGLRPETIFWGNFNTLGDDVHRLFPGMELVILPVDGVYHIWSAGENLRRIAEYYGVTAQAIVEWPGNHLDSETIDLDNPGIPAGTGLIVPGGKRELVNWGAPRITRDNPAVAAILGPGHCGEIYEGAVGSSFFIWPTDEHWISGYTYDPTFHPAIDLHGNEGSAIYASDAGVVVYAGWNDWGYGNVVVIDHGTGWQTLYAHLSAIYVVCGQSVDQGAVFGAMGVSGNSTGSHLHFEMLHDDYGAVNPLDFLP